MHTIKPIDREAIIRAASSGAIVTAEDHSVIGGLGSAVAEVLVEEAPTMMRMIGVRDKFGESGSPNGHHGQDGADLREHRIEIRGIALQMRGHLM